jgi:hypothetical protein
MHAVQWIIKLFHSDYPLNNRLLVKHDFQRWLHHTSKHKALVLIEATSLAPISNPSVVESLPWLYEAILLALPTYQTDGHDKFTSHKVGKTGVQKDDRMIQSNTVVWVFMSQRFISIPMFNTYYVEILVLMTPSALYLSYHAHPQTTKVIQNNM